METMPETYIKIEDIKESGYYWWLPEYLCTDPYNNNNWQIITVIVGQTNKVGRFVGPLVPPNK